MEAYDWYFELDLIVKRFGFRLCLGLNSCWIGCGGCLVYLFISIAGSWCYFCFDVIDWFYVLVLGVVFLGFVVECLLVFT